MSFHVEHSPAMLDDLLLRTLSGGRVFAVGGRVRDEVLAELGRPQTPSQDLDYLVTGLPLEIIIDRLSAVGRAELVGASFGVIKFTSGGRTVDVALPRRERPVGPKHRDFAVDSAPDIPIEEDLARRDFRMNMLARNVASGEIVDPYGGRADIEARRLDPLRLEAFSEDPLRVLRGAQFAARFEFAPSPLALAGMRSASDRIPTVAPERVNDELTKLLTRANRPSVGFELLRETSALHHVLPELLEGWQVDQNEFHKYTVYYHSLYACDAAPRDLVVRLAALLHDVAKPRTKEGPHFYRHEQVGESMTRAALERLRFPNDVVDRVCHLVVQHMYSADSSLSDAAVRRFIKRVGPESVDDLFRLRRADIIASGLPARDPTQQERFEERVHGVLAEAPPFGLKDLAIDGGQVKGIMRELGMVDEDFAGDRRVGEALQHCLEQVLEDPRNNDAAVLRSVVRGFFGAPDRRRIEKAP